MYKKQQTYPGSNKHDILSLGSIFPLEVCRFLAFSSPPMGIKMQTAKQASLRTIALSHLGSAKIHWFNMTFLKTPSYNF